MVVIVLPQADNLGMLTNALGRKRTAALGHYQPLSIQPGHRLFSAKSGRLANQFCMSQVECLLFPKADVQFDGNRVKTGSAFGHKQPLRIYDFPQLHHGPVRFHGHNCHVWYRVFWNRHTEFSVSSKFKKNEATCSPSA